MATVAEKQAGASPADTADEAAIVQHMRDQGTLPQWEQEVNPPPLEPPPRKARLRLPCGAVIWAERSPGGYFYHGIHLRGFCHHGMMSARKLEPGDFDGLLRALPGAVLAEMEAAVADLRQIVGTIT